MLQVTPQMRVLVAVTPIDFRRGIDGLAQVVREQLAADPFSGAVFVFRRPRPRGRWSGRRSLCREAGDHARGSA